MVGIPALAVSVWLPIVGWHLALALATVAALVWGLRHEADLLICWPLLRSRG